MSNLSTHIHTHPIHSSTNYSLPIQSYLQSKYRHYYIFNPSTHTYHPLSSFNSFKTLSNPHTLHPHRLSFTTLTSLQNFFSTI